ncbi:MAG: NAD(+) synthase [Candidatus Fournierella pullistercoris]|uniref:Glutamine-dependent NAD(+) synthetase n=1 Tax=Candidatus Allofournierella pullistercoris TaxID=2838597 RepID=A0A948T273_9FIRM|nr:NAD(+) synthase [Candidatus Fournierella pullistercoris]
MKYGFVKVASGTPEVRVADCRFNASATVEMMRTAAQQGVEVLCLPELGLTGYTCQDLFLQPTLQQAALDALEQVLSETKELGLVCTVGLPVRFEGKLYNCAAVIQQGNLLALVPKACLPNYGEFYEARQFSPAPKGLFWYDWKGTQVPFGTDILLRHPVEKALCIGVEVCEDLWSPIPPSSRHALAGATLILNLSASDEIVGKAEYRRSLVQNQSARLLCGYLYADAGCGESTTDLVFAGHNLICENGTLLAQTPLFSQELAVSEIDVQKLETERSKNTSFVPNSQGYHTVWLSDWQADWKLERQIAPYPFVPADQTQRVERCQSILEMQARGLAKRLSHTRAKTAVIGISGGLDSTLALLVLARAFAILEKPMEEIVAVTMPAFGTTQRTRNNAHLLCQALGVSLRQVDVSATVRSNFVDIGHSEEERDVTYENTQARVRTLVLMNLANKLGGLVIGTGDLSELALGWATYNGDHMSMYGVNGSIPKTLVRHMVQTVADASQPDLKEVLLDILDTPVSPELLPPDEQGEIAQQTEKIVGPYTLHDFYLYYAIRWGFEPEKIFWLAQHAFAEMYTDKELVRWLENFYRRFFNQQFKRSCLPDGPKVGSVSLSPRGDWRMPSDACATVWLEQVERLKQGLEA